MKVNVQSVRLKICEPRGPFRLLFARKWWNRTASVDVARIRFIMLARSFMAAASHGCLRRHMRKRNAVSKRGESSLTGSDLNRSSPAVLVLGCVRRQRSVSSIFACLTKTLLSRRTLPLFAGWSVFSVRRSKEL